MPKPRMMITVPSIFFIFQSPKSVPGTTSCCSCAYSFPAFRLTLRISDGGEHITLAFFPKAKVCIKRKMFLVLIGTCFQEEKALKHQLFLTNSTLPSASILSSKASSTQVLRHVTKSRFVTHVSLKMKGLKTEFHRHF